MTGMPLSYAYIMSARNGRAHAHHAAPNGWKASDMASTRGAVVAAVVLAVIVAGAGIGYNALKPAAGSAQTAQGSPASASASSGMQSGSQGAASTSGASASSMAFPQFTVNDDDGNVVALTDMRGKPSVLAYWATWCPYCLVEAPMLQELWSTYGDRINFMMIDVADGTRETVEGARAWIAENGYTYPVYYDIRGEATRAGAVSYLPMVYVLDAEGNVVGMLPSGFTVEEASQMFDSLLA